MNIDRNVVFDWFWRAVLAMVLTTGIRAENPCLEILKRGIFNTSTAVRDDDVSKQLSVMFQYSYDELKNMSAQKRKDLGISVLSEAFYGNFESKGEEGQKKYESLRGQYLQTHSEQLRRIYHEYVMRSVASPEVLRGFNECLKQHSIQNEDVSLTTRGDVGSYAHPGAEFLLALDYAPKRAADPKRFTVSSINYVGAAALPPTNIGPKTALNQYEGLTQRVVRNGVGQVIIRATLEGHLPVEVTLPALPKPIVTFRFVGTLTPLDAKFETYPWTIDSEILSTAKGHILQYDQWARSAAKAMPGTETRWVYTANATRTMQVGSDSYMSQFQLTDSTPSKNGVVTRVSDRARGVLELIITEDAFEP